MASVAQRPGITTKSLYNWKAKLSNNSAAHQAKKTTDNEPRYLKAIAVQGSLKS